MSSLAELEKVIPRDKWLQLVVRTKPRYIVYLRKAPSHIRNPSPAQREIRGKVGLLAQKARGLKVDPVKGPPLAEIIAKGLKNYRSPLSREPVAKRDALLRLYLMELRRRRVVPIPIEF
jgi:hypothetical protein